MINPLTSTPRLERDGTVVQHLAVFAHFVANQGTGRRAADSSQRAAKHSVTGDTTQNGTSCSPDLGIGWIGAAACQCDEGSGGD